MHLPDKTPRQTKIRIARLKQLIRTRLLGVSAECWTDPYVIGFLSWGLGTIIEHDDDSQLSAIEIGTAGAYCVNELTDLPPLRFLQLYNGYMSAGNEIFARGSRMGLSWGLVYVGSNRVKPDHIDRLSKLIKLERLDPVKDFKRDILDKVFVRVLHQVQEADPLTG